MGLLVQYFPLCQLVLLVLCRQWCLLGLSDLCHLECLADLLDQLHPERRLVLLVLCRLGYPEHLSGRLVQCRRWYRWVQLVLCHLECRLGLLVRHRLAVLWGLHHLVHL